MRLARGTRRTRRACAHRPSPGPDRHAAPRAARRPGPPMSRASCPLASITDEDERRPVAARGPAGDCRSSIARRTLPCRSCAPMPARRVFVLLQHDAHRRAPQRPGDRRRARRIDASVPFRLRPLPPIRPVPAAAAQIDLPAHAAAGRHRGSAASAAPGARRRARAGRHHDETACARCAPALHPQRGRWRPRLARLAPGAVPYPVAGYRRRRRLARRRPNRRAATRPPRPSPAGRARGSRSPRPPLPRSRRRPARDRCTCPRRRSPDRDDKSRGRAR